MSNQVIVLGAKGRFGRAAVTAFLAAGWQVRAFARSWDGVAGRSDVEYVEGSAFDAGALMAAARGCDVIVNALNPPYPRWKTDMPRMTEVVIAAAKAASATVMIPGNVYNYGEAMPEILTEATPHAPTARKGVLREEMERAYAAAGIRTIVLRAGDFIEREMSGNWFDSYIAAKIDQGRAIYPGPRDRVHTWAYLPDMARAMVGLAEKRADFAPFEDFGFEGFSLTGGELIAALERASGKSLKVAGLPWPIIRLLGLVAPQMREVAEMSYLWRVPHQINGSKLTATLPELQSTSLDEALAEAIGVTTSEDLNVSFLPAPMETLAA